MNQNTLSALAALLGGTVLSFGAYAQIPPAQMQRNDINQDQQNIQQGRNDVNQDRKDIQQDLKSGNTQAVPGLRRDINNDQRDIKEDRKDINQDWKDLHQDQAPDFRR